jgi:hypothetical protein
MKFVIVQLSLSASCVVYPDISLSRIRGSQSGGYEEFYLLGYNAVYSVESKLAFRRKMSFSVLRVEEYAEQESSLKWATSGAKQDLE